MQFLNAVLFIVKTADAKIISMLNCVFLFDPFKLTKKKRERYHQPIENL